MQDQSDDKKEQSKYLREEMEVRKGARVKPGDSNIGNAESEGMEDETKTEGHTEGIEQDGSVKNSK